MFAHWDAGLAFEVLAQGGGGASLRAKFPSGNGLLLWDDWIDRLTKRYGDRVKQWAGWNEPDIGSGRFNTFEDIAAFCLRTAKVRRSISSDVVCPWHFLAANML